MDQISSAFQSQYTGIIMFKKYFYIPTTLSLLLFSPVSSGLAQDNILSNVPEGAQAVSLTGKTLSMPEATNETVLDNLSNARVKYMDYPMIADNAVWYGRRLAYAGKYREAIKVFSEGMIDSPNDAQFYRHRGHRYITIREFDRAIADLEKAVQLIKGKANIVEQARIFLGARPN